MRSLVHADARLAERTAAHVALAEAHRRAGEEDVAVWHSALATLVGDPALVPGLLRIARRHLDRGDVVWAHEVAREAASQAGAEHRAEAFAIAGVAALRSGHVQDAADWLRKASRSGTTRCAPARSARSSRRSRSPRARCPTTSCRPTCAGAAGRPPRGRGRRVVTGVLTAARLHAERGDGVSTSQLLDTATFLASWCEDDATAARLALARSWAAVFGVGSAASCPTSTWARTTRPRSR